MTVHLIAWPMQRYLRFAPAVECTVTGINPSLRTEAYAHTNAAEYFAELTEAYFGQNDWYPHNRQELKGHDPVGFAMIEAAWGVTQDETD